jgi:hypothetical protein
MALWKSSGPASGVRSSSHLSTVDKNMQPHPGIRIDKIPAAGGGGLIFALGMVSVVLLAIPAIRPLAGVCLLGGLLLAPVLHRLNHY